MPIVAIERSAVCAPTHNGLREQLHAWLRALAHRRRDLAMAKCIGALLHLAKDEHSYGDEIDYWRRFGVAVDVRCRADRQCHIRAPSDRLLTDTTLPSNYPKHSLPMEIIKVMPSYRALGDPGPMAAVQDSTRIQGGDWSMQGFRRSGHVHDEGECQMSIADFMAEQRLPRDSDDA